MGAWRQSDDMETTNGEVIGDGDSTNGLLANLSTYLRCWLNELGIVACLAMAMTARQISSTAATTNAEGTDARNYFYVILMIS